MRSRYPGIRSFETHESALFFGRQRETKELYNLIKVKRFVVLFAKSGIGKTSLLNAGVIPLLTQEEYYPIKVRFQQTDIAPADMLLEAVKSQVRERGIEARVAETLQRFVGDRPPTLWEYLKACSFEQNDLPAVPLLIFDQFEEFFLHSEARQKPFIDGISDVLFERVPEGVQEAMRAVPRRERTEAHLAWATPLQWKIIFAIRSDRLSLLDNLSRYIPIILDNRYQLNALGKEAARAAVVAPAALPGDDFQTPIFSYNADTLDAMLHNLSNEKGEVESFQLQILCEYVERQVAARRPATPITIYDDYLSKGGDIGEGVQEILNSYYEQRISELGSTDALLARRLIEEGLIMNGVRISLPLKVIRDTYSISDALLAKVLDTRIVRAEVSHIGLVYEVSHDTLVAPIVDSYERRMEALRIERERQEAERRAREAAEQREAELREQQKERRRQRTIIAIVSVAAVVAILLAVWGFVSKWRADAATVEAKQNSAKAIDNLNSFLEAELRRMQKETDTYQAAQGKKSALFKLEQMRQKATELTETDKLPKAKIEEWLQMIEKEQAETEQMSE